MDVTIADRAERDARQVDRIQEGQVLLPFRNVEKTGSHEDGAHDSVCQHHNLPLNL